MMGKLPDLTAKSSPYMVAQRPLDASRITELEMEVAQLRAELEAAKKCIADEETLFESDTLRAELTALRAFVGSEMLRSDFQTATQMRAALDGLRDAMARIATACENCATRSELQDWARDAMKGAPLPEGPCSPVICEALDALRAAVARARERMESCLGRAAKIYLFSHNEDFGKALKIFEQALESFDAELGTPAPAKIPIPSDADALRNCICEMLDELEKDPDGPADGTEFDAIIRARILVPEWKPSAMRGEGGGDGTD